MKNNGLYTIFLDFDGGTYVSQVWAFSNREAMSKWFTQVCPKVEDLSVFMKSFTLSEWEKLEIVPLSGLKNIWCGSLMVKDNLAILHLVATDKED